MLAMACQPYSTCIKFTMALTYYTLVGDLLSRGNNYGYFGGNTVVALTGGATVNIFQIIYDEFASLPPQPCSAYVYSYVWDFFVSAPEDADFRTEFASIPPRFKLGHLTISDKFGVTDDAVWRFKDQKSGLYRGFFRQGDADPGGSIPPPFPPPENSVLYSYGRISTFGETIFANSRRGNRVGIFPLFDGDYFLNVDYYATLIYNDATIVFNGSTPTVGIFP